MQPERPSIWLHDSIQNASGKAGAVHPFTSRSDDAHNSSVVSIDAPVIHGLLPWRPIDSEFQSICNCNARLDDWNIMIFHSLP